VARSIAATAASRVGGRSVAGITTVSVDTHRSVGRADTGQLLAFSGADEICGKVSSSCGMTSVPENNAPYRLIDDVEFGDGVIVGPFTNLYGCRIGDETRIGPFVEIQRDAVVGARCKIQSHSFICTGVVIEDQVFVGHGTLFINDKFPAATTEGGELKSAGDWHLVQTVVERRASLGSGVIVLGGVRIGAGALVGAGAVVTRDVAPGEIVAGVPARVREQR
jgi:UDP-2-acetamido-3-amino-2,3-dideoxy-glucuronate N-acetyltransferase